MSELPFQCEYAKSGRSKCKACKKTINQGDLRMAAMVQSAFFDGKQAIWFHETCFFTKQRPQSASDIGQLTTLRQPDRERVIAAVESLGSGAVLPVAKGKGKATKRAANSESGVLLKDFKVEYSKSSRATCKVCEIKIVKDEVRVCKIVFDTEVGQKYGGQPLWHHVKCFNEDRANLLFFAGGENLPGLASLSKDDQAMVKKEIPPMKQSDVPIKKLKDEKKDSEELKKEQQQKKVLDAQDKLFFKHRDSLKKHVTKKADLQSLLEHNSQGILTNSDKCLDALADCMTFGALKPCSVCKNGQLNLDTHNYYCSGNVSEWTKCNNKTRNPERVPFLVPDEYAGLATFKRFKPKAGERIFALEAPVQQIVKTESELTKLKVERRPPPLKNLDFFIHKTEAKKDEIKKKILKLGGNVSAKLNANLAAVVSTEPEVQGMSNKIAEIRRMDIQIVPESIFDLINKDNGTIAESIQLIIDKNIASWGSDPNKRVPQDVLDGKSIAKSGSLYVKSGKSNTLKLKLKGGTAVDPDSGLEDRAHVYKDSNGLKWAVVLGLTDVVAGKNSFYKLQLLESDGGNRYWVFRSWGRIGTSIGGNKTEDCRTVNAAKTIFKDMYLEKTENVWGDNDMPFMKVPGRMYPIDLDYGDENEIQAKGMDMTDSSECKLAVQVQGLVKMIFDINQMKKVLLEFELDTEKMPLGKLSRKQITSGYKVLTELLKLIQKANGSSQAQVIDATNRFYTLIPHDFGVANPPLLDTEEVIKTKTGMLDNLLEIEIAYSMMKTEAGSTCPITANYIKLKTEIVPIVVNSPEYEMLQNYTKNTHAKTHSQYDLEIVEVFKVVRSGEEKRFKPFKKLNNRRLLWHGSRVTNFAGILSQGLRIAPPEAPVTGYMFGKGIYFADMVSKSANYCCTHSMNPIGVLLLCEVACGKMKECYQAEYVTKLPSGMHSVLGVGRTAPDPAQNHILEDGVIVPLGTPVQKTDINATLLYNEYIVYDIAQVNVKYLFQMKFNYKY